MSRVATGLFLSITAALLACNDGRTVAVVDAKLRALPTCEDVQDHVRETAIRAMNDQLDAALRSALSQTGSRCWAEDGYGSAVPSAGAPSGGTTQAPSSGAQQTSSTNNQVTGVDEADFLKNDDRYLYVTTGQTFRILQAWPAESTHEIGRHAIEGEARKVFVSGERAVVYSSLSGSQAVDGRYRSGECTYGYDCQFTGDGRPTKLTVFDITDRTAPRLLREIRLSGSYVGARRIGNAIHTVVTSPGVSFNGLRYWPQSLNYCQQNDFFTIVGAFQALRESNERLIRETPLADWLPAAIDTRHTLGESASANLLADCGSFFGSMLGDGSSFITVVSFDLGRDDALGLSTIVSRPGAIYSSAEALYLAVPHEQASSNEWFAGLEGVSSATDLHKFRFAQAPLRADYVASGAVKGRVLNQFAMDEYQGHLRVATSVGRVPSPDVYSTLSVLRHSGPNLFAVGMVDHLAPHEDIRSVRFAGPQAFMVTFKKTDPLYTFDLSSSESPRVLGELHIPGFSTYMHMMDDRHLLTIGYDAEDHDTFAYFQGVLLQIFDVSNPSDPRQLHREVIGTRGSSSEALTDHLAFTYFAPRNLLALPMTICEGSAGGGTYGNAMTFSGLMVYDATVAGGFNLRGRVAHPRGPDASCSNWWTNASSEVKRSVFMDDYVFSVSESRVKVNRIDDLGVDLANVLFTP